MKTGQQNEKYVTGKRKKKIGWMKTEIKQWKETNNNSGKETKRKRKESHVIYTFCNICREGKGKVKQRESRKHLTHVGERTNGKYI